MPCYHPLQAYQCADGLVVFSELGRYDLVRSMQLNCGQCIGCRLERSRQWAMHCVHEASLYEQNCFITLTYNDEHVPPEGSLLYRDFQLFMKRLRRRFFSSKIRYFMCGEYGEDLGRPHFHACLFNFNFADKTPWRTVTSGTRLFRSPDLELLWPSGFSSIGEVTFESAAYVARYVMKKVTGEAADAHYFGREPEFCHMSLKPGIGSDWLRLYWPEVVTHGTCRFNGIDVSPPRFYTRRMKRLEAWEKVEFARDIAAHAVADGENSDERLAAKERVATARIGRLKRSLK